MGNRKKARTHLEAAVERSPDYPENRICLAEAYAKWSEGKNLQAQLKALEELEAKARAQFSGLEWAAAWDDWQDRLYKLRRVQEHLDASSHVTPPASEHVPRGRK